MCVESRAAATIFSQFKKKGPVKLNLEIQGQMFGGINRFQ